MKVASAYCTMPLNSVLSTNRMGQTGRNSQGVFGTRLPFQQNYPLFAPNGTSSGVMDLLNKQKMAIEDRKNELLASAQEKGLSQDYIQAQLDSYDEQIKKIDEQISEVSVQQMMTAAEQQKTVIKQNDNRPKTEQEIQNEKMNNLMAISSGFDRISITNSVKNRIDGASRVLKTEIELDKARAGSSPGAAESIAKKEEELAAMQQQSRALNVKIGEQIADVNEQIQENNKPIDKVETDDTTGKDDTTVAEDKNDAENVSKDNEQVNTSGTAMFQAWISQYIQMENLPESYAPETAQVNIFA